MGLFVADDQGKTAAVDGVFFGDIYCRIGIAEIDLDFVRDDTVAVIGNFDAVGGVYADCSQGCCSCQSIDKKGFFGAVAHGLDLVLRSRYVMDKLAVRGFEDNMRVRVEGVAGDSADFRRV